MKAQLDKTAKVNQPLRMKTIIRLPLWSLTFFIFFLLSARTFAIEKNRGLRDCKSDEDCIMINMNCGQPGAVNKKFKAYSETPPKCEKTFKYEELSRLYTPICVKGKCQLNPKMDFVLMSPQKTDRSIKDTHVSLK